MPIDRIWDLLTKKFNNEISKPELEELEELLHENQDALQLNELLSSLRGFSFKPVSDDLIRRRSADAIKKAIEINGDNDMAENITGNQDEDISVRSRKGIRIIMAILATSIFLSAFVWFTSLKKSNPVKATAIVNEIKTHAGFKTTVNLPDGSVVILNAGSNLSYNKEFGISRREISLTGEAFFDIRKNPQVPLVVHAGTVDIWVKGTSFNVKAYPNDSTIETVLLTGIIELISKKKPGTKILLRPNEKIVIACLPANAVSTNKIGLGKNETVSISRIKPDPIDSSYAETAWLQNKIVFHSEAFKSIARNMERKYNVVIHFLDNKVGELIFTGSFSDETLPDALDALKSTVPFQYKIDPKIVYISK